MIGDNIDPQHGGEMKNLVATGRGAQDRVAVAHVSLDQFDLPEHVAGELVPAQQPVEHDDAMPLANQARHQVAADKTRSAGNQQFQGLAPNSHGSRSAFRAGGFAFEAASAVWRNARSSAAASRSVR